MANFGLRRVAFQLRAQGIREQRNALRSGVHSRGYLPHVKREGATYFDTFRLADSLPAQVWRELLQKRAEALANSEKLKTRERQEIEREFRRQLERSLDAGQGECYLQRAEIAEMTTEALLFFDGKQYLLDEWVVMPNHVHLILWPMPNYTLSAIVQSRKRHTAREANRILGRTGESFWQPESYDHWIRDDDEKTRIRRYIRHNPVRARLSATPEDWPWSSAHPRWEVRRLTTCGTAD